jgi:hypothetical protein
MTFGFCSDHDPRSEAAHDGKATMTYGQSPDDVRILLGQWRNYDVRAKPLLFEQIPDHGLAMTSGLYLG